MARSPGNSLFWIAFLLSAMFLGPFMLRDRADLELRSRSGSPGPLEELRDAPAEAPPPSISTGSFPAVPPFSLDNR